MLTILTQISSTYRSFIVFATGLIIISIFLPNYKKLQQEKKHYQIGHHYPLYISNKELHSSYNNSDLSQSIKRWNKHTVGYGENSAILFQRLGLSSRLLYQLANTNDDIKSQLTKLKPGDILEFGFDENQTLAELRRSVSPIKTFIIYKTDSGFDSKFEEKELNFEYNYVEAKITSNFWNAAINAGLTANQIMEIAEIFGWDIDFSLDIRIGDQFKVLYQEQVVEGEIIGRGKIVTAIFTNQGRTFTAILDDKTNNYYDQNGHAMKKAFLRSPVDFRRVSSNFNPRRLHPITGKIQPHRGTDYAAPIGTPVWAAGDGIVQKSSYNKFNGNYVFIRHNQHYVTKYLHLEKRMVKVGQRVKQGQTIGTVGATGRVTGPHLHYEFLFNGVHKNARTVELPKSNPLTGEEKTNFITNAKIYLIQLNHYRNALYENNVSRNS
ncbi:metalloprotease [Candidatus Photodesmus katoptron]|uniref:peptidoglycan DD-metalloendopeptidase family protein n=1 Tax=Candidatus Photodesmus anomalopis TaxID=28176 RepID=UPI0004D89164|nr:peptidoglycan DD-metalloendopeptidase family protein [Candidatus Photodesmus katoptron]KEY90488.1 metalloprotease [Candidatus Photodesmus katoptron]